ncbi:MAG: membrane integrity-associated transporter subunit PqiC, partial [Candidatus Hydrogenedentes bacterium]|nr:membrane integrity-associated transporter subunit PqiC [Candidatus Hydrogenedentota bacterium]
MRHVAWIVIACMAAGCATTRYTPTVRYRLDSAIDVPVSSPIEGSLGIRTLTAARPYKQTIVFQDADFVVRMSDHEEWADLPAVMVTRMLMDALGATKHFKDVGDAVNLAIPDYILTGELRRFDLVRAGAAWSAVCEVRLELRKGMKRELVWSDTLRSEEPLAKNEVSALPAAMSRAVDKVITRSATATAQQ